MATARLHDSSVLDVHVHGTGPTILMHPQPAWSLLPPEHVSRKRALEAALVESLSDRYRLVFCEYPGEPKPETLTPANVVADLLAIAAAADADRFAWCGYSWTAVIGLQLAIATDRLTSLACGGWPAVSGRYGVMLSFVSESLRSAGDALTPTGAQELRQFATFYGELQDFDDWAVQEAITCPRLCFAGSADDIYGSRIGPTVIANRDELERLGWDVRVVEGRGHEEMLEPDVFVPVVESWFDRRLA